MKVQVNQWPELQLQQDKAKMELNEKEKVLNKSSTELTAQYDQASAKVPDFSWVLQNLHFGPCSVWETILDA